MKLMSAVFLLSVALAAQASRPLGPITRPSTTKQEQTARQVDQQPVTNPTPAITIPPGGNVSLPAASPLVVSVNTNQPETKSAGYNWEAVNALVALVIGALQVWILINQNSIAKKQTEIAESQRLISETQTTHMEKGLVSAKASADAAKQSSDTAATSLQLLDRPWVNLQSIQAQSLEVTADGDVVINLLLAVGNVGKSVAQHIDLHMLVMPRVFPTSDVEDQRRLILERSGKQLETHKPQLGFALFPGERMNRPVVLPLSAREINRVWPTDGSTDQREIPLLVFGALMYSQSIKTESRRTTSFCFEVRRVDPTGLGLDLDPLMASTAGENLRLVVSPVGLHHAD